MKKSIKVLITVLVLLIFNSSFLIHNCICQWQPDVRLTNAPDTSRTGYHNGSLVTNGNFVHVVWFDKRDGNFEIYYKRSTDAGMTWSTDTRLTNDTARSYYPSCALNGSVIHVIWSDNRSGTDQVYYKRSIDTGFTWSEDTLLTNETPITANYFLPHLASSGSLLIIMWSEKRDGNNEIYYKRSTNGGISWGAETRLTNDPGSSNIPSVTISGLNVHVAWYDNRDGNDEIYYKYSIDGGINWDIDTRLTNDIASSFTPTIAVLGSSIHVVWHDQRDGNWEIYYKLSTNGGISWGADTRLTNDPATSQMPSISVSGSNLHVIWNEFRDGNMEIYYKRNPTGNPIGIRNITSEIPVEYKLKQNYPNPFNPSTNIRFALPKSGFVKLVVFDVLGREVETLVNEKHFPGTYEVTFDGSNYPSGIYFYRLTTDLYNETKKMLMIK
jgi:hypothetical protein